MNKFINYLVAGKEWIFSGIGVTIVVAIISWILKNKPNKHQQPAEQLDNRPIFIINNIANNGHVSTNNIPNSRGKAHQSKKEAGKKYPGSIELNKIRLYTTGIKGKVYNTKIFHKKLNHNLGVELSIYNNTNKVQQIAVRCCVKNNAGKSVYDKTKNRNIQAHKLLDVDVYVHKHVCANFHPGSYTIQYWVNGESVQKFHVEVVDC